MNTNFASFSHYHSQFQPPPTSACPGPGYVHYQPMAMHDIFGRVHIIQVPYVPVSVSGENILLHPCFPPLFLRRVYHQQYAHGHFFQNTHTRSSNNNYQNRYHPYGNGYNASLIEERKNQEKVKNAKEMLGLKDGFTKDDLGRAFRRKSALVHPDKNTSEQATAKFQQLSQYKQCLQEYLESSKKIRIIHPEPSQKKHGNSGYLLTFAIK